jgi:hypothetical protein
MQARVKQDFRWKTLIALGGVEFVKNEWRTVPPGKEKEAQAHPFLEIEAVKPDAETLLDRMVAETVVNAVFAKPDEEVMDEQEARKPRKKKE